VVNVCINMIRFLCSVEDFTTQQPIAGCTLDVRVVVAPRLLGTLPNLSLAQQIRRRVVTPSDGRIALELDVTPAFAHVHELIRSGQAAGTPVAYIDLRARCAGFDLRRASPRALEEDDAFEATFSLDFAKAIVGHTTTTETTLWFCLHKSHDPEREEYACEIHAAGDPGAPPLQRHLLRFRDGDANTAIVRIAGLDPGTAYRYVLRQTRTAQPGDPPTERELTGGRFSTFSDERDASRLALAFTSCHSPIRHSDLSDQSNGREEPSAESVERWVSLDSLGPTRFDMLFLMGDQIYADGIEKNFPDDSWFRRFSKRYHQQWEYREVRRVLASRPTYMILDDHDVRDDFGTVDEFDGMSDSETQTVIDNGLAAYRLFQHAHNPGGPDGPLHYHFRRGPAAFFVVDGRTHRRPDPDDDDVDFPVIGRSQLDDLRDWAADSEEVRTADVIVLVMSVPPAWLPVEVVREAVKDLSRTGGATFAMITHPLNLVAGAIGYGLGHVLSPTVFACELQNKHDAEDQWTFGANQRDLSAVLTILFDLANGLNPRTGEPDPRGRKRAVFVLGGDVHMGGAHVIRSDQDGSGGRRDHRSNAAIFGLTSSPISHPPETDTLYQNVIAHASDDIDPGVVFVARALDLEVSDDSLLDVLGRKPAKFVLDSERDGVYRAELLGLTPTRNYGLLAMRRLDAPGRQYEFSFAIEGQQSSAIRSRFTMNLDARRVVPVPTSPGIVATPALVNFGSVIPGGEARKTVAVQNVSGGDASISIPGSDRNAFFTWPAFSGVLGHGERHIVDIVFRPAGTGHEQWSLSVSSDVLSRPLFVGLMGKGAGGFPEPGPEPQPPRRLVFDPATISFGSVPLNTRHSRSFTIQNGTGVPVRISIPASPAGIPFSWQAFRGTVAAGATRRVEVQFRPRTRDIAREQIRVTSNAPGSPHVIGLLGKGPGGF
jgi:hypothetical protein